MRPLRYVSVHPALFLVLTFTFWVATILTFVQSPLATAQTEATVTVRVTQHPTFGPILTDGGGKTLYVFLRDEREKSNCTGECAQRWPPLQTKGDPVAGQGAARDRLGVMRRPDGTTQVTYNGRPLYYWGQDAGPADAKGQDVGQVWYVVSSYGGPVFTQATVTTKGIDRFGEILTDHQGWVLYLFTEDGENRTNCTGTCALNWPPLLTARDPSSAGNANAALLGTIRRDDGTRQVTYKSRPLYYFNRDRLAGEARGQGVFDAWYVVNAQGQIVR